MTARSGPRSLFAVGSLVVALAGCGSAEKPVSELGLAPPDADPGHVHAVGVDPQDGTTFVAAHTGLFSAAPGAARASRVGEERRDVMGFSIAGPGRLVGSGHPDPQRGGPSSVGFIRSDDGGRSWQTVSLAGEADLHALEVAGTSVFGFDAISGTFRVSRDAGRTWGSTEVPPMFDIAVDPRRPDTIIASTESGVLRSTNGGEGFRPFADAPVSHLAWSRRGPVAVGLDGVIRRIGRRGEVQEAGRLEQPPAAAAAYRGAILVAMDDGSVLESADAGATWRPRLRPTAG